AYSLCFSLPGAVLLRYGDEIGMGDDLRFEGCDSVRTPMQWSSARNGGFTTKDDHLPKHPVIREGHYSYLRVNVCEAHRDPESLLSFMERLIVVRRCSLHIGLGTTRVLLTPNPAVFAHSITYDDEVLVFVHNLGVREVTVRAEDLGLGDVGLTALFGAKGDTLGRYGYRWARISKHE